MRRGWQRGKSRGQELLQVLGHRPDAVGIGPEAIAEAARAISIANSGLPPVIRWSRATSGWGSRWLVRSRRIRPSGSSGSGPTREMGRPRSWPDRDPTGSPAEPDPCLTDTSTPIRSSATRRRTNDRTRAEGPSIHWRSSIATTSGASAARLRKAWAAASETARWSTEPPGASARQQGRVEGLAERGRHPREQRIRGVTEEIAERGVGQPGLRLRAATLQDAVAATRGLADAGQPERGLADPRGPLEHERARAGLDAIEERGDVMELVVASDDRGGRSAHWALVAAVLRHRSSLSCASASRRARPDPLISTKSLGIPYDAASSGGTQPRNGRSRPCPTPSPPSPRPSCRRRG